MVTPNRIRERIEKMNPVHSSAEVLSLYRDVLLEVASGSIDPRTLAIEAIKAEDLRPLEKKSLL